MAIDSQNQNSGLSSSSPGAGTASASSSASDVTRHSSVGGQSGLSTGANQNAMDILRGSVTGVLENVVREYEPQIAQFTNNIARQAVDRGVSFVQTAGQRLQKQSWMRLGLAAALGVGIVAVLGYEASEAADKSSSDRSNSRSSVH